MLRRIICLVFSLVLTVTAFAGCSKPDNADDKLSIVTTIFPVYDFARQITSDKADVTMLLQPGMESHSYEPTPQDIIKIQKCDIFFYIGGESDEWINDVLSSIDTDKIKLVPLMDCVSLFEEEVAEGMQAEEDHDHNESAEHGDDEEHEYDEHIWTSPANAVIMMNKMTEVICSFDSENSSNYKAKSNSYCEKIKKVDSDIDSIVNSAARKTLIFGDRFPFRYFVEQYGLEYSAAFPGCASQTEPSAATVAYLIDAVKNQNIPVVFYIEFSDKKMAKTICEATGAKSLQFNSCHNVTKDEFKNGITYVQLMEQNVEALREALC